MKKAILMFMAVLPLYVTAQCTDAAHVYSFAYGGHHYELIKQNRNWADAQACAVARGGYLVEINDAAEQAAINSALAADTGINVAATIGWDGGGASYIWTGGNDISVEGRWIWNTSGIYFWQGTTTGTAIGGNYENWGSINFREPDNYLNKQHCLGLAITNWPNGLKGEWNDIDGNDTLYYLVEHNAPTEVGTTDMAGEIKLIQQPNSNTIKVVYTMSTDKIEEIKVFDATGRTIPTTFDGNTIDVSGVTPGIYILRLYSKGKMMKTEKIQIVR